MTGFLFSDLADKPRRAIPRLCLGEFLRWPNLIASYEPGSYDGFPRMEAVYHTKLVEWLTLTTRIVLPLRRAARAAGILARLSVVVAGVGDVVAAGLEPRRAVDFDREIRPILSDHDFALAA